MGMKGHETRDVLPEYVCGARQCRVAGQSAMQSQLHYVGAGRRQSKSIRQFSPAFMVGRTTLLSGRGSTSGKGRFMSER
jgi:hypothetical protein